MFDSLAKSEPLDGVRSANRWLRAGLLCVVAALGSCYGPAFPPCEPKERGSATSADGIFKAVELFDDCGNATVAFYTEVVVRAAPEAHWPWPFDENTVLLIKGDVNVTLEWRIGRVLKITVPKDANVQQYRARIEDLPIVLERQ